MERVSTLLRKKSQTGCEDFFTAAEDTGMAAALILPHHPAHHASQG
jgi:hypothetical protein